MPRRRPGLLIEAGRRPCPSLGFADLLLGRFGRRRRPVVARASLLVVLAAAGADPAGHPDPGAGVLAGGGASPRCRGRAVAGRAHRCPAASVRPGLAVLLVVLHGCFVAAAMLGAQGLVTLARGARGPSTTRCCWSVLAVVAASSRRSGSAGSSSAGHGAPGRQRGQRHPGVHGQRGDAGNAHGILVIRGDVDHGLTYTSAAVTATPSARTRSSRLAEPDARSPRDVRALVSRPTPGVGRPSSPEPASSTSCCPRPPTATSPPGSTRPTGSARPAPRTGPPAPGRSTPRSTRTRWTGPARGCAACCWSSRRSRSSWSLVLCLPTDATGGAER